jgi:hypothetical protein
VDTFENVRIIGRESGAVVLRQALELESDVNICGTARPRSLFFAKRNRINICINGRVGVSTRSGAAPMCKLNIPGTKIVLDLLPARTRLEVPQIRAER